MFVQLAGRIGQFALALISVKLMTTWLSPVEVGRVTLATTVFAFFSLSLINPVGMFVNRRVNTWVRERRFREYFHTYILYLVLVGVGAIATMLACRQTCQAGIHMAPLIIGLLAAGHVIFNSIVQTLVPTLNILGRVLPFAALTLAALASAIAASVLFVGHFGAEAESWLAGTILSHAVFSVVSYLCFFGQGPSAGRVVFHKPDRDQLRTALRFCWPLAISVCLGWVQFQGYRFYLAEEVGAADYGLFAAGYGVAAALMAALEMLLTTWFLPRFYRELSEGREIVAWNNYVAALLPITVLGLAGLVAAAAYLVPLMLGPAFRAATVFVVIGAIAEWGRVLLGIFSMSAHAAMRTHVLILPYVCGAFVGSLLIVTFLPIAGLWAAAIAAGSSAILGAAIVFAQAKQAGQGVQFPLKQLRAAVAPSSVVIAVALLVLRLLPQGGALGNIAALFLIGLSWVGGAYFLLRRAAAPNGDLTGR